MTLPVSRLINVQLNLTQQPALGRNFNELLILGDSNVISGLERERTYQDLASVAADFGILAPEYLAAQIYYAQVPKPISLAIGRWLRTATAAMLQGAILTAAEAAIAAFQQVTSGGFDITVDGGSPTLLTGINFSAQTNLNGVAAVVNTALSGAAFCVWNGEQFVITSPTTGGGIKASGSVTFTGNPANNDTLTVNGYVITFVTTVTGPAQVLIGGTDQITMQNLYNFLTTSQNSNVLQGNYSLSYLILTVNFFEVGTVGNAFTLAESSSAITLSGSTLSGGVNTSTVSYATSPASGQDVSSLMGLTASQALPLVPGYSAESALAAVVALDALDDDWYGLIFAASTMPSDSDNLEIAAFIEADSVTRMFGVTIQNTNVLSSEVSNDLASELKALNVEQTFSVYCSSNPYAAASIFGRMFTVNFSGSNTMIDLMYKQMPLIVAENLTTTQANVLQNKRCNVFVSYDNDTSIIQYAVMAGPAFIDETFGDNALQNALQTACYNVLYTSPTKIPQTDQGENAFVNAASGVCQQFVNNGFGAPGIWNATGFGSLVQGQNLKLGYYIFAPPVSSQSESDRAARKSVPFQIAFKLAGSTQTVTLLVTVNQ